MFFFFGKIIKNEKWKMKNEKNKREHRRDTGGATEHKRSSSKRTRILDTALDRNQISRPQRTTRHERHGHGTWNTISHSSFQ